MKGILGLTVLSSLVTSSTSEKPHHPHSPREDATPDSHQHPRQAISAFDTEEWSPQGRPDLNINPSWSPDPNSIEPISLDGISPWNDDGRSQMDIPEPGPWLNCPLFFLNCARCPRDFRCLLSSSSSPTLIASTPSSQPIPQLPPPPPRPLAPNPKPASEGEPSALTGPQLTGPASAGNIKPHCPLQRKCGSYGNLKCGAGATCKKGLCACPAGKTGAGTALRGWTWPEALSVYVDPGVACSESCEDLFCTEAQRVKECFGLQTGLVSLVSSAAVRQSSAVVPGGLGTLLTIRSSAVVSRNATTSRTLRPTAVESRNATTSRDPRLTTAVAKSTAMSRRKAASVTHTTSDGKEEPPAVPTVVEGLEVAGEIPPDLGIENPWFTGPLT